MSEIDPSPLTIDKTLTLAGLLPYSKNAFDCPPFPMNLIDSGENHWLIELFPLPLSLEDYAQGLERRNVDICIAIRGFMANIIREFIIKNNREGYYSDYYDFHTILVWIDENLSILVMSDFEPNLRVSSTSETLVIAHFKILVTKK